MRWLCSWSGAFNNLNEDRSRMHSPVTGMSWQHRTGVISFNLSFCVFFQNLWWKCVTYFDFTSIIVTVFKDHIIDSASQHRNGVVSLTLSICVSLRMYWLENRSLTSISPSPLSPTSNTSTPFHLHNTVTELFFSMCQSVFYVRLYWKNMSLTSISLPSSSLSSKGSSQIQFYNTVTGLFHSIGKSEFSIRI